MHNIKFKSPELVDEWKEILPRLRVVLEDMALFCSRWGHEFIITDLMSEKSEDEKLKRVSKSHQEGRAADIRVRDWPLDFRKKFEDNFNKLYEHWAAISKETGKPRLIVIHDNSNGIHTHVQIRAYKE